MNHSVSVRQLLDEFIVSYDFAEAERCVRELEAPNFMHEVGLLPILAFFFWKGDYKKRFWYSIFTVFYFLFMEIWRGEPHFFVSLFCKCFMQTHKSLQTEKRYLEHQLTPNILQYKGREECNYSCNGTPRKFWQSVWFASVFAFSPSDLR